VLRSEGRRFEVGVEYLEAASDRPLDQQILSALKGLVSKQALDGDVLVFLPGAGEIRRTLETCAEFAQRHGLLLLPLHGDLPPREQDRAVRPRRSGRSFCRPTSPRPRSPSTA
jgi:ATP-dependent helicase HrpB